MVKIPFFAFILFVLIGGVSANAQTPKPEKDTPGKAFAFTLDGDGGYLGVRTEEVSKDNLAKYSLRDVKGVGVESVVDGSPAQAAGIQAGDVILKVNGDEITSARKLTRLIGEISPDHQARITVLRGGSERDITVTVGKRPGFKFDNGNFQFAMPNQKFEMPVMPKMPDFDKLPQGEWKQLQGMPDSPFAFAFGSRRQIGAGLLPLSKQLADHFGVEGGVLVNEVRENSPAAKAGLKAGDIIVEADGKPVKGDGDLARTIGGKKEGSINLTIVRDRSRQTITVTPEEMKGFDHFFEFTPPDPPDAPTPGAPATPGVFRMMRPAVPLNQANPAPPLPLNELFIPGRVV